MELIVVGSLCAVVGFGLGWFTCGKLAPKVGAIETKVATLEKDVKNL
jgi:hypothetical protein